MNFTTLNDYRRKKHEHLNNCTVINCAKCHWVNKIRTETSSLIWPCGSYWWPWSLSDTGRDRTPTEEDFQKNGKSVSGDSKCKQYANSLCWGMQKNRAVERRGWGTKRRFLFKDGRYYSVMIMKKKKWHCWNRRTQITGLHAVESVE